MSSTTTRRVPAKRGKYDSYEFSVVKLLERLGDVEDESAAEMLGIAFTTFRSWKYRRHRNFTAVQADVYACRIGLHPSAVWGDQWWRSA
jgi:hypothetical protein